MMSAWSFCHLRTSPRLRQTLDRSIGAVFVSALLLSGGCVDAATDNRATSGNTNSQANSAAKMSTANKSASAAEKSVAPVNAASTLNRERCIVTSVTDGDSMRCMEQGRVRLLLLDAPEMSQTPYGERSRDALRRQFNRGDTVWLEYDVQRNDQYGRALAHVWTAADGGTHVNLAHASDGWAVAVVFQPNVRYIEAIRRAVASARQEKRGLWSDGQYRCEPIDHKRGNC